MEEFVRYKHSVNSGDLIAAMPGMKYVYEQLGKKAVIQQRLNMPGDYGGQEHPLKDDNGMMVTMSPKQWEMLKPLLESQEYVERAEIWEGQETDLDFDKSREVNVTTMPFGSINRWIWYVFPAIACDLSIPWLKVDKIPGFEEKVVVNFTSRYRNPLITFYFLDKWPGRFIFAGTKEECNEFNRQYKLNIPYLEVKDFLELAQVIASCKFLLSNQSMCWNIAEALKAKRVCETRRETSNCIPNGPGGYDFLQQTAAEFYVNKFIR